MHKKLPGNLRLFRERKNVKQEVLAEILQVDRTTISKWENGVNEIDLETLEKIADFLKASIDDLMGRNPANYSSSMDGVISNSWKESKPVYVDEYTEKVINMIEKARKISNEGKKLLIFEILNTCIASVENEL